MDEKKMREVFERALKAEAHQFIDTEEMLAVTYEGGPYKSETIQDGWLGFKLASPVNKVGYFVHWPPNWGVLTGPFDDIAAAKLDMGSFNWQIYEIPYELLPDGRMIFGEYILRSGEITDDIAEKITWMGKVV